MLEAIASSISVDLLLGPVQGHVVLVRPVLVFFPRTARNQGRQQKEHRLRVLSQACQNFSGLHCRLSQLQMWRSSGKSRLSSICSHGRTYVAYR